MKLVKSGTEWHLIDEDAPPDACVIATLRDDVEAAALKRFCERYLDETGADPGGPFSVEHAGHSYTVFAESRKGKKLILRIVGTDGAEAFVRTEFVL